MNFVSIIYERLLEIYGPQGWWPILGHHGTNPTKTGRIQGYHRGDYSFPKTEDQKFEICAGAILTQNTSFVSVEKSLKNLQQKKLLQPKSLIEAKDEEIQQAITPSGYQNQKTKYLKTFAMFFSQLSGRTPTRKGLLDLKGIGSETADSMLLYAFSCAEFVIDAYTKRVFQHLGFLKNTDIYDEWKSFFQESLKHTPKEKSQRLEIYQEYHALIVEHAKRYYQRKPHGEKCPFKLLLQNAGNSI